MFTGKSILVPWTENLILVWIYACASTIPLHCTNIERNRARDKDKNTPGQLQILHYNIDRFPSEIKDLRGLETLLIATYVFILYREDGIR